MKKAVLIVGIPVLWLALAAVLLHQYTRGCERETARAVTIPIQEKILSPPPAAAEAEAPVHILSTKDICVLTYFDGGGKMAGTPGKISMANKKRYCEMHNYNFFEETISLDPERPASWVKLLYVQRLLMDPMCEWVFFMDADALITNMSVTMESIVAGRSEDIFYTKDLAAYANGGVFIMRRTPYVLTFITRVYAEVAFLNHVWWEQAAIQNILLKNDSRDLGRVARLPQRTMNSFWPLAKERSDVGWRKGDFMVHFAGRRSEKEPWNVTEFIDAHKEDILF